MITEYHRPDKIEEAIILLEKGKNYVPFGGGTTLQSIKHDICAIDLQNLGLDKIDVSENLINIGGTATLEALLQCLRDSKDLWHAITIEATKNQRDQVTIAGLACSANGRSPLLTLLSALDTKMIWQPGDLEIQIGDWLALREDWSTARLITAFRIDKKIMYRFESIGRSPLDTPILCLAIAIWPSKRMRVAAGGFGKIPTIVIDGNIHDNLDLALESVLSDADDEWASADYRMNAAKNLANRMIQSLLKGSGINK